MDQGGSESKFYDSNRPTHFFEIRDLFIKLLVLTLKELNQNGILIIKRNRQKQQASCFIFMLRCRPNNHDLDYVITSQMTWPYGNKKNSLVRPRTYSRIFLDLTNTKGFYTHHNAS